MKYTISNETRSGKWRFVILPPNNRKQPLGVSPWYSTIAECEDAKRKFLALIYNKAINRADDKYVKIERTISKEIEKENNTVLVTIYKFYYYDDNNELVFFRKKGFCQKYNCIKCLKSIFKAVEENY